MRREIRPIVGPQVDGDPPLTEVDVVEPAPQLVAPAIVDERCDTSQHIPSAFGPRIFEAPGQCRVVSNCMTPANRPAELQGGPWSSPSSATTLDRRQRRRNRKVEDLLEATAAVLVERGYNNTSLDEIGERMDLGKASIYHYFNSKEELVYAALEACASYVDNRMRAVADSSAPPAERLRQLVRTGIELMIHETPLVGRLFVYSHDWPPDIQKAVVSWRKRHDATFADVIAEAVAAGEISPLDPKVSRLCLMGALVFTPEWVHDVRGTSVDQLVEILLRLFTSPTTTEISMRPALKTTMKSAKRRVGSGR
jgi:AcrR family transcriptional regulator